MAVTLSEIPVDFRGEIAGVGELTWGQMGVWRRTRETGRTMNVVVIMPLPESTALTTIVASVRFVVSRHPALRTRLRFVEEPFGQRRPQQVVAGAGHVPLQILDIDTDDDPAAVAEQLRSRYELTWFDYEHEFPVRMGVVRCSGVLLRLVAGYSHVMTDGAGLEALARDFAHFDQGTGEATVPARVLDPLRLADVQNGPAGRRQNDKCMRYWAAQLGRLPVWRLPRPTEPPEPRYAELVLYSPAMALALSAVAARTRAASTYVLLAAYAVAVARVMGRNPNVALIVVNNRFRPGFADTVGMVNEPGICVVDVADATFDDVVGRALTAVANASLHAYYDTRECERLLEETEARRGAPLDVSWHVNDRRGIFKPELDDAGALAPLTPTGLDAAMRDALPRTKLYWDRRSPVFDGTLFIQVDSSPEPTVAGRTELDEGLPAVYFEVWADMHHFTAGTIEAFVREMEAVVVAAAFDGTVPTGVRDSAAGA
ncbi:MAG TPA: condensation domain-containing protein [Actinocrinis sp.]|uniref:condensation domain-containing protein n=1 Tax=Actinocrinis sp. TaxID=1920516 RepID=UPI002DDD5C82|nr:condensation domain-containing protein [Actinocrinis sp.]HEV2342772.1 condensation domain-containing protein [Actinocrinis sp.]